MFHTRERELEPLDEWDSEGAEYPALSPGKRSLTAGMVGGGLARAPGSVPITPRKNWRDYLRPSFKRTIKVLGVDVDVVLKVEITVTGARGEIEREIDFLTDIDAVGRAIKGKLDLAARTVATAFLEGKLDAPLFGGVSFSGSASLGEASLDKDGANLKLGKLGAGFAGKAPELLDLAGYDYLRGKLDIVVSGSLGFSTLDAQGAARKLAKELADADEVSRRLEQRQARLAQLRKRDEAIARRRTDMLQQKEALRGKATTPALQKRLKAIEHEWHQLDVDLRTSREHLWHEIQGVDHDLRELREIAGRRNRLLRGARDSASRAIAAGMDRLAKKAVGRLLFKLIPVIGWASTILDVVDIVSLLWDVIAHWGEDGSGGEDGEGKGEGEGPGGAGDGDAASDAIDAPKDVPESRDTIHGAPGVRRHGSPAGEPGDSEPGETRAARGADGESPEQRASAGAGDAGAQGEASRAVADDAIDSPAEWDETERQTIGDDDVDTHAGRSDGSLSDGGRPDGADPRRASEGTGSPGGRGRRGRRGRSGARRSTARPAGKVFLVRDSDNIVRVVGGRVRPAPPAVLRRWMASKKPRAAWRRSGWKVRVVGVDVAPAGRPSDEPAGRQLHPYRLEIAYEVTSPDGRRSREVEEHPGAVRPDGAGFTRGDANDIRDAVWAAVDEGRELVRVAGIELQINRVTDGVIEAVVRRGKPDYYLMDPDGKPQPVSANARLRLSARPDGASAAKR